MIYTDEDKLLFSNLSAPSIRCGSANEGPPIGCRPDSKNRGNPLLNDREYIPLNGGIDSEESGEDNSSEEARLRGARLPRIELSDNPGAQMARLERSLSAGEVINRLSWYQYLEDQISDENPNNSGRATRLAERLVEEMDEDEYRQWGEVHGWVDDAGEWHAPNQREAHG